MDDVLISLTIGRTALIAIGLLLLLFAGTGVVIAFMMRRRMMGMMRGVIVTRGLAIHGETGVAGRAPPGKEPRGLLIAGAK